jgi:tetratricopeptide (TPR) repeat protein
LIRLRIRDAAEHRVGVRTGLLVLAIVATSACAKKAAPVPPVPVPAVDLQPADGLVEAGCYRCLQQAFAIYARALENPAQQPEARERAFVTAVLLALREKEIGLEATPWLDRAAELAIPDERAFVDIAAALPWTNTGATDFEPAKTAPGARDSWLALVSRSPQSTGALESSSSRLLRHYLLISLTCTGGTAQAVSNVAKGIESAPLVLRYRLGVCGASQRPQLEAVIKADSRYAEASFFVGRYEMASGVMPRGGGRPNRQWLTASVPPLRAAHEGIPESPVIATVLASLMRSRKELRPALELYDAALARRPTQRDALLGRAITLTYLERRQEAIDTATRMIELGTWYVGSAYYWRALNRYHSALLDLAALDIAAAKQLQFTDDVMLLSGMIAYDQKRPADARKDFATAIQINRERCAGHWYLGILDVDEETWASASRNFSTSGACYQQAAESLRAEEGELPPDLPEETRREQLAELEEEVATSLRQAGRSFLNAAQASLRVGDRSGALAHARIAVAYPDVKERAQSLVRSLEP